MINCMLCHLPVPQSTVRVGVYHPAVLTDPALSLVFVSVRLWETGNAESTADTRRTSGRTYALRAVVD